MCLGLWIKIHDEIILHGFNYLSYLLPTVKSLQSLLAIIAQLLCNYCLCAYCFFFLMATLKIFSRALLFYEEQLPFLQCHG